MKENSNINININLGNVIKITLFFIFLFLLYKFHNLVLVLIAAIVLASALEPAIKKFQKIKFPRTLSVVVVYILMLISIVLISLLFIPSLVSQTDSLIKDLPNHSENLKSWLDIQITKDNLFSQVFLTVQNELKEISFVEIRNSFDQHIGTITGTLFGIFGSFFNFLLILVLSFYFAVQENGVKSFLKIITPVKHISYILNFWGRSQKKIGRWMQGQFLLVIIIGVVTYIGLKIFFDFEQTLLLAILAGFTELIPVIGPLIAAIPAMIIGFLVGGTSTLLWVMVFYFAIQLIENNLVQPLVVKNILGIPPFLAIVSLIIGAQLFGFIGIILSIPITAIIMEFIRDVEKDQLNAIKKGENEKPPTLFK